MKKGLNLQMGCNMFHFIAAIMFSNLWMLVFMSGDFSYQWFIFHQKNIFWGNTNFDMRPFYIPYKYKVFFITIQMYI